MQVKVSNITYGAESQEGLQKEFLFEIADEIALDDETVAKEIQKLIFENTGLQITDADVDID